MKKQITLTVVLTAMILIIAGCSKKEFDIVNTWKNDQLRHEEYYGSNYYAGNFDGEGKVSFYSDNTGNSTCEEFIDGDFTWTLTNSTLTVTKENNSRTYKLTTMEYETMVAERDTRDNNGDGTVYIFTFSLD